MPEEKKRKSSGLVETIITCMGIGHFPIAPGTAASIAGTIIYFFFLQYLPLIYFILILIITTIAGIIAIKKSGQESEDPSSIVIDELCGIWLSLITLTDPFLIFLGLVLFRIFDIAKPFPIGYIDKKMKNGIGIMLDDIVAGIIAALVVQIVKNIILSQ